MYDVLVYGPLFSDFIFTDLPSMPELGTEIYAGDFTMTVGGSAIVAAGLHRLGAKVGLIADLGNDPLSRLTLQLIEEIGFDTSLIRQHPHPLTQLTVALSFSHDRSFVTRFERPKHPPDLAEILKANPTKHIHVCSFLAVFDTPDACEIAHASGATISMDPGWDEQALHDVRVHDMLADLDFFLPSRSELCHMMKESDMEKALDKVVNQMSTGQVVMKNGADGAIVRGKNSSGRVPALPVTPIDTTGAGDAFDAGFLYALTQNYLIQDCMRYGSICGSLTTTVIGGATGTPTLEDVQKWLPKL